MKVGFAEDRRSARVCRQPRTIRALVPELTPLGRGTHHHPKRGSSREAATSPAKHTQHTPAPAESPKPWRENFGGLLFFWVFLKHILISKAATVLESRAAARRQSQKRGVGVLPRAPAFPKFCSGNQRAPTTSRRAGDGHGQRAACGRSLLARSPAGK